MVTVVQPLFSEKEMEALARILEYLADEKKDYAALGPEERSEHIYHSVLVLRASGLFSRELFDGGKTCSTPGAVAAMERAEQQPWEFLCRHFAGDWGEVCLGDWQENELSLEQGFRLLSSYRTTAGERLWAITEADRSVTTLLLPEEY
jgi:hypothetical protein